MTLVVVDAEKRRANRQHDCPARAFHRRSCRYAPAGPLGKLLDPDRIVVWDDAVSRNDIRRALVKAITSNTPTLSESVVLAKLAERENQGSTFLNEGVALPHARIEGLESPQCAWA